MDTKVREVVCEVPGFGYKVQRLWVKSQRHVQVTKGQTERVLGLTWDGQGLTRAARNRLGIDERVQDNVSKRVHSPEGVQRPETDICARIHGAGASLQG